MHYVLSSNDAETEQLWAERLIEAGYDVRESYDTDAVIIVLGGDGSILYAAREYDEPTILPVRTGDSEGNRATVNVTDLLGAVERIDQGSPGEAYSVTSHSRVEAYTDGQPVQGGFTALNEISLHHATPSYAAKFAVRVEDAQTRTTLAVERAIGDGVVVATPFGSTAYYRSITDTEFNQGIGVAFNNLHRPSDVPTGLQLSKEATVELEVLTTTRSAPVVLTRDNDRDRCQLDTGEVVTVRSTDTPVEILHPEPAATQR